MVARVPRPHFQLCFLDLQVAAKLSNTLFEPSRRGNGWTLGYAGWGKKTAIYSHVRSREGTEGGEPTRTGTEQNGGVTETDRNERERRRTDVGDERVEWEVVSVVGPGVRMGV